MQKFPFFFLTCQQNDQKLIYCNSSFFLPASLPFLFSSQILWFLPSPFTYLNLSFFPLSSLQIDRLEVSGLGQAPLSVSCGADSSFQGGEDITPDPHRTKQAIAQLQQKILKLTEQIKIEQTARDDNVAEYLKLANNADKQQSTRIKQVKRGIIVRFFCIKASTSLPCAFSRLVRLDHN